MDAENNEVNEPQGAWQGSTTGVKTLTFFNSFEEAKDYGRKRMAEMSPKQRLENLEEMRKHFLKHLLLPNGQWPPFVPVLTIKKGVLK